MTEQMNISPYEEVCTSEIPTVSLNSSETNVQPQNTIFESFTFDQLYSCSESNLNLTSFSGSNQSLSNNFVKTPTIKEKLQQWVLEYNVSKNSVNSLLGILRTEGLDLPKDVRTLMNTPRTHNIIHIQPGTYIHLGLEKMLSPLLNFNKHLLTNINEINLGFNIDGLPLAKSSKRQFWPILCSVTNVPQIRFLVFAVGIYYSSEKKPESIEDFLNLFIEEALDLINRGISINNKLLSVNIDQVICDAPAKSFLLNVKSSTVGCNSCNEEGVYMDHRMTFLGVNSSMRTDYGFRNKVDDEYHKGNSPLERLPINIIEAVPLDYMHLVCLGVMKRLLKFWVRGNQSVRIPIGICKDIDTEMLSLRKYFPKEFARLPRPLNDIEHWKATEFRNFLLFTGPLVLKKRLKKAFYLHFMKLHCAIKILITPDLCLSNNEIAHNLIVEFVEEFKIHYGAKFVTYNVHSLIHLSFYVKLHGCLDNFSAFKYENYLGLIKKQIKNSQFPLQEAVNRIIEKMNIFYNNNNDEITSIEIYKFGKECDNVTLVNNHGFIFYENVTLNNNNYFICTQNTKNNYIMLMNNEIASVKHICKRKTGEIVFEVCTLKCSTFFNIPVKSDLIFTFIIDGTSESELKCISVTEIKYKCFFVEMSNGMAVVMALSHNLSS